MTDDQQTLRLVVIMGSTRAERICPVVTAWFLQLISEDPRIDVDLCDLADIDLPTDLSGGCDTESFAKRIAVADAVVLVTPEYNHGYPGVLKIAIDSVWHEWRAKPVGFVCYGGVSGGLRAVEQLRGVFGELHAVPLRDTVSIASVADALDNGGRLIVPNRTRDGARTLLRSLSWWGRAMTSALESTPYPI